ncbi:MAG: hypothetical protein GXX83_09485 [Gaiellales bacterium]|nr:hypothetical protein [Gaiellales bacterium]
MTLLRRRPARAAAFREPTRHFRFSANGITHQIEESRRVSFYFVLITQIRGLAGQ